MNLRSVFKSIGQEGCLFESDKSLRGVHLHFSSDARLQMYEATNQLEKTNNASVLMRAFGGCLLFGLMLFVFIA